MLFNNTSSSRLVFFLRLSSERDGNQYARQNTIIAKGHAKKRIRPTNNADADADADADTEHSLDLDILKHNLQ